MSDSLARVENACRQLADAGDPVTFTTIAEHTGISRTTLYRSTELRTIVEEHRQRGHDPRTLSGLTAEIGHLRTAVNALADRVRHQEERLRRLERNHTRRTAG